MLRHSTRFLALFVIYLLQPQITYGQTPDLLHQRADSLLKATAYAAAIPLYQQAEAAYEKEGNFEQLIRCQNALGQALMQTNAYQEAEAAAKRCLANISAHPSLVPYTLQVEARINLASLCVNNSTEEACTLGDTALAIAKRFLPPTDPITLRAYVGIGAYRLASHEYMVALRHFQEGLRITEQDPERYLRYWRMFKISCGRAHELLYDYETALHIYKEVEAIPHATASERQNRMSSTAYNILGGIYDKLGDTNKALDYYQKSSDHNRSTQGTKSRSLINDFSCMAEIYQARKEWPNAVKYYQAALAQMDSLQIPETQWDRGYYRLNLAEIYVNLGQQDQAEATFTLALKGVNNTTSTLLKKSIARYYLRTGQTEAALTQLYETLALLEKQSKHRFGELSEVEVKIGDILCTQQRYPEALDWYEKALQWQTIPANRYTTDSLMINTVTISALSGKAKAIQQQWQTGSNIKPLQSALSLCQTAIEIAKKIKYKFQQSTDQNFEWLEKIREVYALGIKIAWQLQQHTQQTSYAHTAWQLADQNRAFLLLEGVQNSKAKAFAGVPDSLLHQEAKLTREIAYFERLAAETQDPDKLRIYRDNELFTRKRAYEALIHNMEKACPAYFQLKHNTETATAAAITSALPARAALIEYFKPANDNVMYCFLHTAQKGLQVLRITCPPEALQHARELNQLVRSLYLTRDKNRQRFIYLSHQLYQYFVAPFATQIEGIETLFIVNDGPTHDVPFEILLPNADDQPYNQMNYLLRKFIISYPHSGTLFARTAQKREISALNKPERGKLLAFAPVFNDPKVDSSPATLRSDWEFLPLYYSEQEVQSIANYFGAPNVSMLLHEDANETALKAALQKPHWAIHLASHSFVDLQQPKFSGIACAQIQRSTDDGILYVNEIYNLTIPADLVVLSSCESGAGKVSGGEGILGLNRAFAYAGVPNIVYSLWKVGDRASSNMMIEFYKQILLDKSYSAALRAAKLKMLENPTTASPNFWSGFLLMGSR